MTDFRLDTRKLDLVRRNDASELKKPVIISRSVFQALGPLEQLAAQALEKCGSVKIVDDIERNLPG